MTAHFLGIAKELRNKIYEIVLLHDGPINPWRDGIDDYRLTRTAGLLAVCRTANDEASPMFYGLNRFDFTGRLASEISAFLAGIGTRNAGHIREIDIDAPQISPLIRRPVTLTNSSIEIGAAIQSHCCNVRKITMPLTSASNATIYVDHQGQKRDDGETNDILNMVDSHLRCAMPSLEQIEVELGARDVAEDNGHIEDQMKRLGWTVKLVKQETRRDYGQYAIVCYSSDEGEGQDEDALDDSHQSAWEGGPAW